MHTILIMSIPGNLYNIDSTIVPLRSPESYDHKTTQSYGSDDETEVEQWSDDDTVVESEGEEEVRMIVVEHNDDNSDEEFRLLHGLDNGGWGEAGDDKWDWECLVPDIELFATAICYTHNAISE